MNSTSPDRAPKARSFDSPLQEAYLALWRTYDRLRMLEDELFSQWDLTAQQYNILRLLRSEHPSPITTIRLGDSLVSRAPDITRMVDKLETRKLLTRTRSVSDRRSVLVGISELGLALLNEIAEPLRECHEKQLGHLSATELQSLTALLHRARSPHEPPHSHWH